MTSTSTPSPPSASPGIPQTNYSTLTLAELRSISQINNVDPNKFSAKSWVANAKKCAETAQVADSGRGREEEAFVNYLKACQFFELFLQHKEYKIIKQESAKNPLWHDYIQFSQNRAKYLERARSLSQSLQNREVEHQALSSKPAHPLPSTQSPTMPPPNNVNSEPDTSSGGSIAARMAALRGAGMQVQTSGKRFSKDMAGGGPGSAGDKGATGMSPATASSVGSLRTPVSAVTQLATPATGTSSSSFGQNGYSQSTAISSTPTSSYNQSHPPDAPGSRRGSLAGGLNSTAQPTSSPLTPNTPLISSHPPPAIAPKPDHLDPNKTGSSHTSNRSLNTGTNAGQSYPSRLMPQSSGGTLNEDTGGEPKVLTPQGSGSGSTAVGGYGMRPYEDSQGGQASLRGPRPMPSLPNGPSHAYKTSLPNMPTTGISSPTMPGSGSNGGSGFGTPIMVPTPTTGRSRQNTVSSTAASSRKNSVSEVDEVAAFSTNFPSLDEFEEKPDFAMPTLPAPGSSIDRPGMQRGRSATGKAAFRPETISEAREDDEGFKMPRLPSPPRDRLGQEDHPGLGGGLTLAGSSSLSIPDLPQRPSSLPMPDTETPSIAGPHLPSPSITGGASQRFELGPPPIAPKPVAAPQLPRPLPKPSLPFANSITAAKLKEYLDNPALKLLLIDTRAYEEHHKGWIGQDNNDVPVDTVWVDPTILQRQGLDSTKLENALSIQPSHEQKAFFNRKDYDLIVIYDTASQRFPSKGSFPTGPSSLFSIIFENEFRKTLSRSPVLLVGGYEGWQQEPSRTRAPLTPAMQGLSLNGDYNSLSKGAPPIPGKKPSLSSTSAASPTSPELNKASRREMGVYRPSAYSRDITDNFGGPMPQSMAGYGSQYSGQPMIPSSIGAGPSRTSSSYDRPLENGPKPPPPISNSPGPISRKRSDYLEHHNQPYSGYTSHTARKPSLDYPNLAHPQVPPAAATTHMERHESRPQPPRSASIISFDALSKLPDQDDMLYWGDVPLGISGLKNLGNSCYMNSTLQCLSATYPMARFFRDGSYKAAINTINPLGTKGDLAKAFAQLITILWQESYTFLSPVTFRKSISSFAPDFAGTDQHDSQEFLSFLLDGLHEDLNRVKNRPPPVEMTPEREALLETLPPSVAAEKEWQIYKQRNDSFIVDLFQGQYRNRLECLTCHKTSTTYDTFMYLSLPLPNQKKPITVYELIDEFTKTEIMEKEDAWNCPRCRQPRRATKTLSIARLPPVLLIHLKRFTARRGGLFYDKSETPVVFPVSASGPLDLTSWMPEDAKNTGLPKDPRDMKGPYKYELFAVSHHMGNLSNGHYTAYVKSAKAANPEKNWNYCDDSKITPHTENDVIARPERAYLLLYKRQDVRARP